LKISPAQPLTRDVVASLQGGRHEVRAIRRTNTLTVTLAIHGGLDPAGALARAEKVILDRVPGVIQTAEVTLLEGDELAERRRRRRTRHRSPSSRPPRNSG
jgi:hypothetical protein